MGKEGGKRKEEGGKKDVLPHAVGPANARTSARDAFSLGVVAPVRSSVKLAAPTKSKSGDEGTHLRQTPGLSLGWQRILVARQASHAI